VFELQRLRPDHEPAVLAFEQANRAYFAESINDRGDEFYEQFAERHRALLADQQAGVCACYVLVAEDGKVVGRFNLYDLVDGTAVVGYRVAERVAGRGVATSALQALCRVAGERYGLQTLRAAASSDNVASQRVLTKVGFVATGPAEVGGRQGSWYQLVLARPWHPPRDHS
jgi:[ribosomal protein S5]-alanine N-acetyltransferase